MTAHSSISKFPALSLPAKVIFIIWSGNIGGREQCVFNLATHLNPAKYLPEVWCMAGGGPIADELAKAGIPVKIIGWQAWFNLAGAWKFLSLLQQNAQALLHLHTLERRILWMLRWFHPSKIVIHIHGQLEPSISHQRWEKILSIPKAVYICNAQGLAAALKNEVGLRQKVVTVYNGIDLTQFQASASPPVSKQNLSEFAENSLLVGMAGRLSEEKGADYFIEAAAIVKAANAHARFAIVGDGTLKPLLEERAKTLGLCKSLTFLGWRRDIPRLLSVFDIVVLPSRQEALGLVLIESMAMGRPVVAFDLPGIREACGESGAAILVPAHNIVALAEAIIGLLQNPERREQMGRAGRRRAEELFDITHIAKQIEVIYDELH